jgi:hypothetical protein
MLHPVFIAFILRYLISSLRAQLPTILQHFKSEITHARRRGAHRTVILVLDKVLGSQDLCRDCDHILMSVRARRKNIAREFKPTVANPTLNSVALRESGHHIISGLVRYAYGANCERYKILAVVENSQAQTTVPNA